MKNRIRITTETISPYIAFFTNSVPVTAQTLYRKTSDISVPRNIFGIKKYRVIVPIIPVYVPSITSCTKSLTRKTAAGILRKIRVFIIFLRSVTARLPALYHISINTKPKTRLKSGESHGKKLINVPAAKGDRPISIIFIL